MKFSLQTTASTVVRKHMNIGGFSKRSGIPEFLFSFFFLKKSIHVCKTTSRSTNREGLLGEGGSFEVAKIEMHNELSTGMKIFLAKIPFQ